MSQPVDPLQPETRQNAQFAKQYVLDKVDEVALKHQEERREFERRTRGERPWVGPTSLEAFLKLWEATQR